MEPNLFFENYSKDNTVIYTGDVAFTLTPLQKHVEIQAGSSKTFAITLPPAALTKGVPISLYLASPASGSSITVKAPTGTPACVSDAMTAAGDQLVLMSNGIRYLTLVNITT